MSGFSNFSPQAVEIAAPGSNGIYSTVSGSGYGYELGTSMASPIVAGAAGLATALFWTRTSVRPSPKTVEALLMQSARKQASLVARFKDGNIVNVGQLADLIDRTYPPGSSAGDQTLSDGSFIPPCP